MWRLLVKLIRSWWKVDRIRTSPRDDFLLSLSPGVVTLLDGQRVEIKSRSIRRDPQLGPCIVHDCNVDGRASQLTVVTGDLGRPMTYSIS